MLIITIVKSQQKCYNYVYTRGSLTVHAEISVVCKFRGFHDHLPNRIFAIIFSRITGSLWKDSMLCTVTNLYCCKLANFHGLNFRCICFLFKENFLVYGTYLSNYITWSLLLHQEFMTSWLHHTCTQTYKYTTIATLI